MGLYTIMLLSTCMSVDHLVNHKQNSISIYNLWDIEQTLIKSRFIRIKYRKIQEINGLF